MTNTTDNQEKSLAWEDLFQEGTLLDLDFHRFRNSIRLQPEDLGIKETPEIKKVVSLGVLHYIDQDYLKELKHIGFLAGVALEKNSLNFNNIQGVRFVPKANLEALIEELNTLKDSYDTESSNFISTFHDRFELNKPTIKEAILKITDDEEISDIVVNRIENNLPNISDKFGMSWKLFNITMPRNEGISQFTSDEKSQVQDAIFGMISGLRQQIQDRLFEVSKLLKDGKTITMKTVNSVNEVLDKVSGLNFLKDAKLNENITRLRDALDASVKNKDNTPILAAIGNVEKSLKEDMKQAIDTAANALSYKRVLK